MVTIEMVKELIAKHFVSKECGNSEIILLDEFLFINGDNKSGEAINVVGKNCFAVEKFLNENLLTESREIPFDSNEITQEVLNDLHFHLERDSQDINFGNY